MSTGFCFALISLDEEWLYKNPVALAKVRAGISQAKSGESAPDPQAGDRKKDWLKEIDNSED